MFGFFRRKRLKVDCCSVCGTGLVRSENQDSVFAEAAKALFCVSDGMGGEQGGAKASAIVCEEVARVAAVGDHAERIKAVDQALVAAHRRIVSHAAEHGFERMGATAAVLLFDLNEPACAAIAHAGDSRVYRRRNRKLERLTEDHRASAYSHLLTRAVGVGRLVRPDWLHASAKKGDTWVVCSDGVHEMLPDPSLNALIARGGSAEAIALRIEQSVLRAGARDNYSIVVVKF